MSIAVDTLLAEIASETATFEPQLEGLRDFSRLNLQSTTAEIVASRITQYERRLDLLFIAKRAITALSNDGHPGIPDVTVEDAVFDDLADNVTTIQDAFGGFDLQADAVSGSVTFGTPVAV